MEPDNTNSIQNLFTNLKTKQKIALFLGIIIIILAAVLLPWLFHNSQNSPDESEATDTSKTESYDDEQGYTITTETYTNDEGEEVTTSIRTDRYGNTTTMDPDLLTSYFPYQVMREHDESIKTLRYFLSLDNSTKTIHAIMEDCDIENDKALIQEYINSIPVDLSDYQIEYEFSSTDTDCEE